MTLKMKLFAVTALTLTFLPSLSFANQQDSNPVTSGSLVYHCQSKDLWTLQDKNENYLATNPDAKGFEIHPEVQSTLICGDPMKSPPARITIYPNLKVQKTLPGLQPNFEKGPQQGFKFWLTDSGKNRSCQIVCTAK